MPEVRIYGEPGAFGGLAGRDTLTTGPTLDMVPITDMFEPGTAAWFTAVLPDGTVIVATEPFTDNQVNSTQTAQSVAILDPATEDWQSVKCPSTLGFVDIIGSNGLTGGSDVSDVDVAFNGTELVPVGIATFDYHGWNIAAFGKFRCWLVFEKVAGVWQLDEARSRTCEELAATPVIGASAFPAGVNGFGESYAQNPGGNEIAVFPESGHVVIVNYFPLTATTGKHSGSLMVIDPATSELVAFYQLPEFQLADGTPLSVFPRTIATDPTSTLGDERFAFIPDVFNTGTGGAVPFACQEFSYDATAPVASRLAPTSAPFQPTANGDTAGYAAYNGRCNAMQYGLDGSLHVGQGRTAGLTSFNSWPVAVFVKTAGEHSYVTDAPPTPGYENSYATYVVPDFSVGALDQGNNVARGWGVDRVSRAMVWVGSGGVVNAYVPDFPLVARAEKLANPDFDANVAFWEASLGSASAPVWSAGDGGRMVVTATGPPFGTATIGSTDFPWVADWPLQSGFAWVEMKAATVARAFQIALQFVRADGSVIAPLTFGPLFTGSTSEYRRAIAAYWVPADAVFVHAVLRINAPAAGEQFYVRAASMALAPFTSLPLIDLDVATLRQGQPGSVGIRGGAIDAPRRRAWIALQQLGGVFPSVPVRRPQWLYELDIEDFITYCVPDALPADIPALRAPAPSFAPECYPGLGTGPFRGKQA